MKLYTCGTGTGFGSVGHPCGKAADALKKAGHAVEVEKVGGRRLAPWTMNNDQRQEVERLSGSKHLPILVLDDGTVLKNSGEIVEWAKAHPGTAG